MADPERDEVRKEIAQGAAEEPPEFRDMGEDTGEPVELPLSPADDLLVRAREAVASATATEPAKDKPAGPDPDYWNQPGLEGA